MKRYNDKSEVIHLMNLYGSMNRPFFFLIDYEFEQMQIYPIDELPEQIKFQIGEHNLLNFPVDQPKDFYFNKYPVAFKDYKFSFDQCLQEIKKGNSYLLNLCFPTKIETNLSLKQIFYLASAEYKLLLDHELVCFSPETFVKIKHGQISSYPIKGTIDAQIANAKEILMNDAKEHAEHATIVDLIRNDLSKVSKKVRLKEFKVINTIATHEKKLLQMSSQITGQLCPDYSNSIGDVLFELLPAGSVTGAPKKKTVEIIQDNEIVKRNYYTGVFGIFDGVNLDSSVLIRYLEKTDDGMVYKSGGGITAMSGARKEYEELISKVYVPISRNHVASKRENQLTRVSSR